MTHPTIASVTTRIVERSALRRGDYVKRMEAMAITGAHRQALGCGNLAHGFAACDAEEKGMLRAGARPNLGIVTAYNDMLSAHRPYEHYPEVIRDEALKRGAVAQVAGGVPAMCDGVTQGYTGMELSLFSRDTIAMATGIALSHNMFDAAMMLGICDKIVPGLLIGALSFAHLPIIFVPGGPMPTGIPNKEKAKVRELFAQGKVSREELLDAEAASYHSPGTCTFYGTANSNQMLLEVMGLQLPGSSFVNPQDGLREPLTRAAVAHVVEMTALAGEFKPLYRMFDERSVVNGIVGLHATGGSTNHLIHLIAIARAAGIVIDWGDFDELSKIVPLLCRIYPNGDADVNHFQQAGGMAKLTADLLSEGLLHGDIDTVAGPGLARYTEEPILQDGQAVWVPGPKESRNTEVVANIAAPFSPEGGLSLLQGNLGRAVIKTSALKPEHYVIEAPARVFTSQAGLQQAFKDGTLTGDMVAVVIFQGPSANGMPELHKLTPPLGVLQNLGFKVALVTDGRMSGASGKVPAAIHVSPECAKGGALAKVRDGDMMRVDADRGILEVLVPQAEFDAREPAQPDLSGNEYGLGRELFHMARQTVTIAEEGASFIIP